ncbi:Receptor-type guanylate cyclase gcy [Seminavis robusta]|uniref:Receptor-type guanylate cyclase gcy n=1 Tax=Seminavis robusta TaxID=568900 RepID=A0A9N8HHU9_9STRA|nr:Receptor-type guanylate cyclase gcy [Seminavis robusta]|eukprot:Sro660_g182960.1 Receptor-type guanylate cyclase gcy (1538) ;mRNA; f:11959-17850
MSKLNKPLARNLMMSWLFLWSILLLVTASVVAASADQQGDVLSPTNMVHAASATNDPNTKTNTDNNQKKHLNPYFEGGGCLRTLLGDSDGYTNKLRVCNSNDPPEAATLGYCQNSPLLDYTEVRMAGQNWESNIISAWLLQIILSELLEVPTTIEVGVAGDHGGPGGSQLDFHNPDADYAYGGGDFRYGELVTAARVKDCGTLDRQASSDDYQACFHLAPEVWYEDRFGDTSVQLEGAEPPLELGALGYQSFYVIKYTAQNDTSLNSYLGMGGEQNRRKMAETFPRPTTWSEYCDQVSPTNCQTPDETATRPPATEEEKGYYFLQDGYHGHFRYTEQNDCDRYPLYCTGFFADLPCGWGSYASQQLYHNKIALASENPHDPAGGFNPTYMRQLYAAANYTQNNLMVYWPDLTILYHAFMGSPAEFTRVVLPEPTQECLEARVDPGKRCGRNDGTSTFEELVGEPKGACNAMTTSLKKVIGTALYDISFDPDTPEALWSPAYDVIHNFQITGPKLGQVLKSMSRRLPFKDDETYGLVLREATCEWAAENVDFLRSFLPPSHPRVVQDEDVSGHALFTSALVLGSLAVVLVLVSIVVTIVKKNTKVLYYTQPEYMTLFLVGLGFVGVGAIAMAAPPSDATCVSIAWFINIGYAIHLVPLLVRINAINNLATSGKQMQRVRLRLGNLYAVTLASVVIVGVYLVVWMLMDPPLEAFQYQLTGDVTEDGERIITAYDYCGSASVSSFTNEAFGDLFYMLSYTWRALIILPAGMIGIMSLRVREDLNDTRSMSMVLFVHTIVLVAGIIMSATGDFKSDLMGYASLALSADVLLSIAVYILPKFIYSGEELEAEPLPDVFVKTTIVLTDVVGFTAWCSVREPVQVFRFLEELYECIDVIAEKHSIFKVQTIGECWVGASGIPEARSDHAVRAAKFAMACMKRTDRLTKKLEIKFGPDTGDLTLRIGMHSGAVTGGFMKGKGARFELFGDTMQTATLIQQTGESDRIHLSEATASELINLGRKSWVEERESRLLTAQKGEIQTYWIARGKRDNATDSSSVGGFSVDSDDGDDELLEFASISESKQRWIQWNVGTFQELLKQIVARREVQASTRSSEFFQHSSEVSAEMPLEEVAEIIELPDFDKKAAKRQRENAGSVELSPVVVEQLRDYITGVAEMYNDNPFHNFAHASYVVMAVTKYMNRIRQAHEIDVGDDGERFRSSTLAAIHKHTYGVTSDPLTLFACLFSALIHDADHPGVPNATLIKENEVAAKRYKKRSVAEQKSFELAFGLLMESRFNLLRSTICCNDKELGRFRQLVINSVMATDLGDKELKALRNGRWEKAFVNAESSSSEEFKDITSIRSTTTSLRSSSKDNASMTASSTVSSLRLRSNSDDDMMALESALKDRRDTINRKATIVIEHLIQAADVAHMSQHWAIYRKWNERLFRECYKAYREGRSEMNPGDNWYKGEIGFFDFYIIPLSKKLRDCGVFGPTSDENLNYATNNRNQWEREGESITQSMLKAVEEEYARTDQAQHLETKPGGDFA